MNKFIKLITIFLGLSASVYAQDYSDPDFKFFNSRNSALLEVQKDFRNVLSFEENSELYLSLEEKINLIMSGYKELYSELRYLPNPRVVILKDKDFNAMAPVNKGQNPYVIVINSGALDKDQDALLGLLGHELGHLLFKHGKGTVQDTFYLSNGNFNEGFGNQFQNNHQLASRVKGKEKTFKIFEKIKEILDSYSLAQKENNQKKLEYFQGKITSIKRNRNLVNQFKYVLKIGKEFRLNKIRWFNYEDDADLKSIEVLKHLGLNPIGIGLYSLQWLKGKKKQECLQKVKNARPIEYGGLWDNHHGDCWRYARAIRYNHFLNQ